MKFYDLGTAIVFVGGETNLSVIVIIVVIVVL